MVQGLHPKMIDSFTAVKPKTFAEFYSIAKTVENNFKRNSHFQSQKFNSQAKYNEQTFTKSKKKPPKCLYVI